MSNKKTLQTQAVKKKKEYSKEKGKDLVINIAHNTNTNSWHLQILNMFTQATKLQTFTQATLYIFIYTLLQP